MLADDGPNCDWYNGLRVAALATNEKGELGPRSLITLPSRVACEYLLLTSFPLQQYLHHRAIAPVCKNTMLVQLLLRKNVQRISSFLVKVSCPCGLNRLPTPILARLACKHLEQPRRGY